MLCIKVPTTTCCSCSCWRKCFCRCFSDTLASFGKTLIENAAVRAVAEGVVKRSSTVRTARGMLACPVNSIPETATCAWATNPAKECNSAHCLKRLCEIDGMREKMTRFEVHAVPESLPTRLQLTRSISSSYCML